jgi:hypothetical protein
MKAANYSETLVLIYQDTQCHIPEDSYNFTLKMEAANFSKTMAPI